MFKLKKINSAYGRKTGSKKKGADGNLWIVKKNLNGTKEWIIYSLPPKNK